MAITSLLEPNPSPFVHVGLLRLLRPRQIIPGTTDYHPPKDNTLATILSDSPTAPPAPSRAAVPARGAIEQRNEACKKPRSSNHTMSGAPSVRIARSHAGTQPTQVPEEKKPVSPAKKGPADTSDSPQIRPQKGLPAKGDWPAVATQPPIMQTLALTSHKIGEKSLVATPSAAPPGRIEGNLVRSASFCRARFSTPLMARPGGILAPTAASPTSLTDNSEDLTR